MHENSFIKNADFVINGKSFSNLKDVAYSLKFLKAGP